MMTIPQLKAARALLGWTQAQLARAAGMHLNVVNNIERGTANPRQGTVGKLQTALEGQGIIFIGTRGVEMRRDTVAVHKHEGEGFLRALIADILAATDKTDEGAELLGTLADVRNFGTHDADARKEYDAGREARGLTERFVTRDMPGFYPRQSENYRVVEPALLGPVDTVVYADRVAYLFWTAQEAVILKNADLADTKRRLFNHLWDAGREPTRPSRAAND